MKRTPFILLITLILSAFIGCGKMPINPELEGYWRLVKVEKSDTINEPRNNFWSFQLHMGLLEQEGNRMYCYYKYTGDSLTIYDIRTTDKQFSTYDGELIKDLKGDTLQLWTSRLNDVGLFNFETSFAVERIDGSVMQLKSQDARLYFVKY